MALKITVTNKATHAVTTITAQEITLSARSVVALPIRHAQVKSLARHGNDLVITTLDGQVIVVHGFFVDGRTGHNDLVLQDDNGGLWLTDWGNLNALSDGASVDPATVAGGAFTPIDTIDPLLDSSSAAGAGMPWLPLLAAGGLVALAASDQNSTTTVVQPNRLSIEHIAPNPNGTLNVAGHANPGDLVTVTFPDGSTGTVIANADGSYSATSHTPQASGSVHASNVGGSANATYTDTTPPLSPSLNVVHNSDGTLTASGQAEPGSTVTVTFPDGSTGTATAGSDGSYQVNSQTPQTSGTV
ncbi:MAG: BapA prefix-like domain-containing protein, partial [Burkholderiaceae bacterium]|nr:BapA prefix-like domain-containing protein [Burkholderiaceae bacterium]